MTNATGTMSTLKVFIRFITVRNIKSHVKRVLISLDDDFSGSTSPWRPINYVCNGVGWHAIDTAAA